jgi:CubicO group peptidase (beta-lactamase class C family)
VAAGDVPAVVAAVADRDALLYLGAFGKRTVSGGEAVTPDAIFRIASMTKPVTSLAVLMLCDEGRIALDDPVARYVPELRDPRVLTGFNEADTTYDVRPAARPITIRDLLTHTSGIAYAFFHPVLSRLMAAGMAEADMPLAHDPGTRWTYGPGTVVLGRVVERASGQPLDTFCRARIFEPLGMADTDYRVPDSNRNRVVTQHQRHANGALVERPNPATIASRGRGDDGLFSTARDYIAFVQLLLNGGRRNGRQLLREETVRAMAANQIGGLGINAVAADPMIVARPFPFGAAKDKFGLGFQIETPPSEPGMRKPGSLSWAGIFNTFFWIDPRDAIAVVVLMQLLPALDEKAVGILQGVERLVYRHAV